VKPETRKGDSQNTRPTADGVGGWPTGRRDVNESTVLKGKVSMQDREGSRAKKKKEKANRNAVVRDNVCPKKVGTTELGKTETYKLGGTNKPLRPNTDWGRDRRIRGKRREDESGTKVRIPSRIKEVTKKTKGRPIDCGRKNRGGHERTLLRRGIKRGGKSSERANRGVLAGGRR